MDNRVFNVNGSGEKDLEQTLELVFNQRGFDCESWKIDKDKGMILYWTRAEQGCNAFPSKMTAKEVSPLVFKWLTSQDSKDIILKGWDAETDHDGENGKGWRVYCEDWGHVKGSSYAICAITPAVLWYGK